MIPAQTVTHNQYMLRLVSTRPFPPSCSRSKVDQPSSCVVGDDAPPQCQDLQSLKEESTPGPGLGRDGHVEGDGLAHAPTQRSMHAQVVCLSPSICRRDALPLWHAVELPESGCQTFRLDPVSQGYVQAQVG